MYNIIYHLYNITENKQLTKVLSLSVSDEGFSRNVPDEGYSRNVPDEGFSRNVSDEGYSRNVPDEGYSRNASCTPNTISMFVLLVKQIDH